MLKQEFRKYYPSGKVKMVFKGDGPDIPDGEYTEFYESGSIEAEGTFSNLRKQGKWNFYHDGEGIQASGTFKDGYKIGEWNYDTKGLPSSIEWNLFVESAQKFGINYPSNWQIDQPEPNLLFIAKQMIDESNYSAVINIFEVIPKQSINLKEFIQQTVQSQIASSPVTLTLVSGISQELFINGLRAHYCVLRTKNLAGKPMNMIQFYMAGKESIFVLNIFCELANIPLNQKLFDEIVFSFRSPY